MTTGLTYTTYVAQIATMAVVQSTDTNFQTVLPQMITYAENRIYRDLDLLSTTASYTGTPFTVGSRTLTIPVGTVVTTQQMNIITPAGTTKPESGVRNACLPVTKEFLDMVYGDSSVTSLPQYYAPFNDNVFYFGPYPDQSYTVEVVGTIRPASLSQTNATTFLSTYLPDLFIMASMIYVSAYQRNFGIVNNDPQMAMTYEAAYENLLKSALVEEQRKKYSGPGWTPESPAPIASPSR